MSITIKQLQTLASHFHFDMDEAREVIGIEVKKRGRPKSPASDSGIEKGNYKPKGKSDIITGNYKPPKAEKPHKAEKPPKAEKATKARGPSGYNLFVREQGISFKNAGSAWKSLSESERDRWNAMARS